jgi:DNA-binding response OmpR family regulator
MPAKLGAGVTPAQIAVIVLTALGDVTETPAPDLGEHDHLMKPLRGPALSARGRSVLRRVKV